MLKVNRKNNSRHYRVYQKETNFNGFNFGSLIVRVVEDSNFSKFNKSIEFKSQFFLIDILQSETGLEGMLLVQFQSSFGGRAKYS